jgi:hypothetical protein
MENTSNLGLLAIHKIVTECAEKIFAYNPYMEKGIQTYMDGENSKFRVACGVPVHKYSLNARIKSMLTWRRHKETQN